MLRISFKKCLHFQNDINGGRGTSIETDQSYRCLPLRLPEWEHVFCPFLPILHPTKHLKIDYMFNDRFNLQILAYTKLPTFQYGIILSMGLLLLISFHIILIHSLYVMGLLWRRFFSKVRIFLYILLFVINWIPKTH